MKQIKQQWAASGQFTRQFLCGDVPKKSGDLSLSPGSWPRLPGQVQPQSLPSTGGNGMVGESGHC